MFWPYYSNIFIKIHQRCIIIIICVILSGQIETLTSGNNLLSFNIIVRSLCSMLASGDLCHLLITLANSLDQDLFLSAV